MPLTDEEKIKVIEENLAVIGKAVANILEVDQYFGSVIDNSYRAALNIMEDVVMERPTDYFAVFKALTGRDITELIEEAQAQINHDVDEEIVDFITAEDTDSEDYKKKVSDFKTAMLDV